MKHYSAYNRVIPRDLFNESNLQKCYGKLWIELERHNLTGHMMHRHDQPFNVGRCDDDGSITFLNVHVIDQHGSSLDIYRPLNSRDNLPLFCDHNDETISVFNDDGTLTAEFVSLMQDS